MLKFCRVGFRAGLLLLASILEALESRPARHPCSASPEVFMKARRPVRRAAGGRGGEGGPVGLEPGGVVAADVRVVQPGEGESLAYLFKFFAVGHSSEESRQQGGANLAATGTGRHIGAIQHV